MTYRISELARLSGVPATTLRFYETAGLLPADRTAAGYRSYGETHLERLGFISAAKSLGLSLDEIADLLQVWQLGECSAVRSRLEPIVAERIIDIEQRIADFERFRGHLATALDRMRTPAPAGPCRADCGCAPNPATAVRIEIGRRPARAEAPGPDEPGIACTLGTDDQSRRIAQWRDIAARAESIDPTLQGARLTFADSGPAGEVAALAAAEQGCCAFFEFELRFQRSAMVLDARSPQAALGLLRELFGLAS